MVHKAKIIMWTGWVAACVAALALGLTWRYVHRPVSGQQEFLMRTPTWGNPALSGQDDTASRVIPNPGVHPKNVPAPINRNWWKVTEMPFVPLPGRPY